MPVKKLNIIRIDLDSLEKTPVIDIEKSADYSLEFTSKHIIGHLSVSNLAGKVIHESGINGSRFIFRYSSGCKDLLLLKVRLQKQKKETQILVL